MTPRVVCTALALLLTLAQAAQAEPLVVLMPAYPLAVEEAGRLQPGVDIQTYDPAQEKVQRLPGQVVVVLVHGRTKSPMLAMGDPATRVVYVLEENLRNQVHPHQARFDVALGRVVAHEIEHLRRGTREHDAHGWFTAELTRDELVAMAWPR